MTTMADDDRERAVKEVAQVYERIKAQHPLLLLHCSSSTTTTTTQLLAQSLLGDALRALNVALSVMKQQPPPAAAAAAAAGPVVMTPTRSGVVKAEPHQLSPPSPAASADSQAAVATITARRAKKRRSSSAMEEAGKTSSWVDFTTVPYEDGYEWRKYGEKKINGTSHTRSYFRCTYKDDTGCLATKHVQQQDTTNSSDPPMFQVTYNNHNTCSSKGVSASCCCHEYQARTTSSSAVSYYCRRGLFCPWSFPSNATAVPARAIAISYRYGMQQQQPWCGTASTSSATTSSCISGESCDQYSDMLQMAAAEASAGDDFLYDLERFLLGDHYSFKIY